MALIFPFEFKAQSYPQAYIKLASTYLDHIEKGGDVLYCIYKDRAARTKDISGNVIHRAMIRVTPALYDRFFTEDKDPRDQSYELAKYEDVFPDAIDS